MIWQKRARLVVAVVGVACAGTVYGLLGKRLPPPGPPVVALPVDPTATNETGPGDFNWLQANGEVGWHIQFSASSSYQDGSEKFVKAHFVTARGAHPMELWSDVAEAKRRTAAGEGPGDVQLDGHVVVKTADDWHIETDSATYDDQTDVLRMPGLMTFAHDLLSGTSTGASYDRRTQVMMLLADPHIVMTPDATGAGALDASAVQITIDRTAHVAHLDGRARIARDKEVLAADVATLRLADDEKTVKTVELRGRSSVVPQRGAANPPPEMHADDITLGVQADGRTLQTGALRRRASLTMASEAGPRTIQGQAVDFRLGPDGEAVTKLDASGGIVLTLPAAAGAGARTIAGETLDSTGDDAGGLKEMRFDGAAGIVTFTEQEAAVGATPASTRTGTSKRLTLKLNGDVGAIDSAEFTQNVKFTKDADVTATAERAVYVEAKAGASARLELYVVEGARALPRVVNQDLTIEGEMITLDVDSNDVHAQGKTQPVQTVRKPASDPAAAKPKPSLFASDQPLLGYGTEATFRSAASEMTYRSTGTTRARVQQEDGANQVLAATITVNTQSNNLTASGNVTSRFLTDTGPSGGSSSAPASSAGKAYTVRAATMKYVDSDHVAHYSGTAQRQAEIESSDGLTQANTLDLLLDQDSRSIQRLVADGHVYTKSGTREATGNHLVWIAATASAPDHYTLTGAPVYVKEPKTNPEPGKFDCNLSQYESVDFSSGSELRTPDSPVAQAKHVDAPCAIQLPRGGGGT